VLINLFNSGVSQQPLVSSTGGFFLLLKPTLIKTIPAIKIKCSHCGDNCEDDTIAINDKTFCCEGCRQVYILLSENDLCVYYSLDENPGIKAKGKFTGNRFAYLDDEETAKKLVQFSSESQINVTFSLPQMHCSSCVFLLENLHRIEPGIIRSQTNFQRKEVFISFDPQQISLRKVVELLAFTGYEPYISLKDTAAPKAKTFNRERIYKIGVAGFCFANIMMLSFPEYFSSGNIEENGLKQIFTWLNFALSLPVLFYSASGFFVAAFKGLQQRLLNIDAPIALAILVTYARSYYEITSGHGAGYLDSGTGIIFFMLIGRWFQDKTYDSFSFDRDYRSYFPLGVTVVTNGNEKSIPVTQLRSGSRIIIRNSEMIPADAVLIRGNASIDYSFVSGESTPVQKRKGELIYAGGKQTGGAIELEVAGEASQSYITQLWNNDIFRTGKNTEHSFIHPWSRYFTLALFTVALVTLVYWWVNDTAKILPAVSAVLIVACPCSLLLSATFTYGNMLRIFGKNKLYLKNAGVIEALAKIDTIVFDKTGTLTHNDASPVSYEGVPLTGAELAAVKSITRQSSHPLSKLIYAWLPGNTEQTGVLEHFIEYTGKGIAAVVDGLDVKMGSAAFINGVEPGAIPYDTGTHVHVMINNVLLGHFAVSSLYREGINELPGQLQRLQFNCSLLSGDNDAERHKMEMLFGKNARLQFNQTPQQKLDYIKVLQQQQKNVLMLGDGLNDAGALMQSNVGVAVSDNASRFSPACDAILDGNSVKLLHKFIAYARSGKSIVRASFILSMLYNIVGLSFAVQGILSPMVAAILMPASSISIVLLVTALTSLSARAKGL
jgi:P-type Cu+ transporter